MDLRRGDPFPCPLVEGGTTIDNFYGIYKILGIYLLNIYPYDKSQRVEIKSDGTVYIWSIWWLLSPVDPRIFPEKSGQI